MTAFQNSNVVFRCPLSLKQKMRTFAEAQELHLSAFIRNACVEAMKQSASNLNGQGQ